MDCAKHARLPSSSSLAATAAPVSTIDHDTQEAEALMNAWISCDGAEHHYHGVDDTTYDDLAHGHRSAIRICDRCGRVEPSAADRDPWSRLSGREAEVVRLLLSGDRVPRIATQICTSPSTVRNQLSSAFRKLGVRSQQELILLFRDGGQETQKAPPTLR